MHRRAACRHAAPLLMLDTTAAQAQRQALTAASSQMRGGTCNWGPWGP